MSRLAFSPNRTALVNGLLLVPLVFVAVNLAYVVNDHGRFLFGPTSFVFFFIVPSFASVILVVGIFARRQIKSRILLASWSVLLTILPLEFAIRWYAPPLDLARQRVSAAQGLNWDDRSNHEVINDYRARGEDAVPVVFPSEFYEVRPLSIDGEGVIPLSGISRALSVYGNECGQHFVYRSDRHGFTNPPGVLDRPPPVDVVVVGDSFAHGAAVPVGASSVDLIRAAIPGTINLGYGGRGPLSYLATLTEYALPLRPRIVLWYHFEGNDLRNLESERNTLLANYLQDGFTQNLVQRREELDRALRQFAEQRIERSDLGEQFLLLRMLLIDRLRRKALTLCRKCDMRSGSQKDFEYFSSVLETAQQRVRREGGVLHFVYLPAYERYGSRDHFTPNKEDVLKAVSRLEIPIVNIADDFDRHPDPLSLFPLRLNGHYTEEGYSRVAQAVLNHLGR